MKKYYRVARQLSLPMACLLLLAGCIKDDCRHTYTIYRPVYEKLNSLRAKVHSGDAQSLNHPGKIYLYGDRIYLNEQNKGIHVIDNSDPAHPKNTTFITVPGNIDIAMKGSTLYADMYCDLAAFDLGNPQAITVKKYLTNTFSSLSSNSASTNADSLSVATSWSSRDTVLSCDDYSRLINCSYCGILFTAPSAYAASSSATTGTAGSMARFAITGNYLYAADNYALNIINVTDAANPQAVKRLYNGSLTETIYSFKNNLFLGSTSGMSVYDVQDGANPKLLSWRGHWLGCDPVIADDNYAYLTIHAGTTCHGPINELDIYDISNLSQPALVKTYPLNGPQGLSKDGNLLFVCDGSAGLKVYDASALPDLKLVKQVTGIDTYDIITQNGIAYVVTKDGLYQYRYSNSGDVNFLSKLQWLSPINR